MGKLELEPRASTFPVVLAAEEGLPTQVCKMQKKNLVRLHTCLWSAEKPRGIPEGGGSDMASSYLLFPPTSGDSAGPESPGFNHNTAFLGAEQTGMQSPGSKAPKHHDYRLSEGEWGSHCSDKWELILRWESWLPAKCQPLASGVSFRYVGMQPVSELQRQKPTLPL